MNGNFNNLLKFQRLTYVYSLGGENDFVWFITRKTFICFSIIFEVVKHCKQYRQKMFLSSCFNL